jgi:DNA-binding response OmpR family regulator
MISIVDDDESVRAATKALLRSVGYEVETFASAELFLESGALRQTECLVLDVRMPGIDGLELQRRLNAAKSRVSIVFVTAHDDRSHRNKAMEAGAASFFRKPFDANAFVAAIQVALEHGRSLGANCDIPDRKEMLMDIGTEKLHVEIVGTPACMHLKPLKKNAREPRDEGGDWELVEAPAFKEIKSEEKRTRQVGEGIVPNIMHSVATSRKGR